MVFDRFRIGSVVSIALLCSGCSNREPTIIDGSTGENFEATSQAARFDLPIGDRLAFDAAVRNPPGRRYGSTSAQVDALARQTYDGMTAAEVVNSAR